MSNSVVNSQETGSVGDSLQRQASEQNLVLAAKGGGITFAGKLFTFASRFIITFILARALGAADYGLYNLAITALTVVAALAAFGLDSALVRYIAIFARRRDEAGLWGTLQLGLGMTIALSTLLGIGLYVLAEPIANRIFHNPQLAELLRLVSPIIPFLTLNNMIASATQGFKKMQYATVSRDISQPLIRLVLILALALVGLNASGAVLIFGTAIVISTIMLLYFLNRLFTLRRPLRLARRDTGEILRFSVPVFLSDLMTTFRVNIQTLLLGAMSTVASVGIFAIANQITAIGGMFQTAIATASRPIISELYDQKEWQQMGRMYQTTTKWTFTVNLPLFLIMVLFPEQLLAIFGTSFTSGATALILLACAIMVDISTGMCGIILDMTGHTTLKLINSIIRLVLSLGLNFLLIPRWGVVGAAIAAFVALSTINLLRMAQVYVLFRLLPHNASFIKPVAAGSVALLSILLIGHWLPGDERLLYLALQIGLLFAVYGSLIILLGLSKEDRLVLARVRRRMDSLLTRSRRNGHQP